jgi:hypothetical protein
MSGNQGGHLQNDAGADMRIVAIDHRKFDFGDVLPPLHIRSLKRIVLLAGPNGSGKTRLLKRIEGLNDLMIEEQGNWKWAPAFVKDKSGLLYSRTSVARIKYYPFPNSSFHETVSQRAVGDLVLGTGESGIRGLYPMDQTMRGSFLCAA